MPATEITHASARRTPELVSQAMREGTQDRACAAKGLPPLPSIPSLPGWSRWRASVEVARMMLDQTQSEMQEYFGDRLQKPYGRKAKEGRRVSGEARIDRNSSRRDRRARLLKKRDREAAVQRDIACRSPGLRPSLLPAMSKHSRPLQQPTTTDRKEQ